MYPRGKPINIPVLQQVSGQGPTASCSTMDAVSSDELAALFQLKTLRDQATALKARLPQVAGMERIALLDQIEQLRRDAAVWREKREKANYEKHVALGHAVPR